MRKSALTFLLAMATTSQVCHAQIQQIAGNDFQGGSNQLAYTSNGDSDFFVGTSNGVLLFNPLSNGGMRTATFDTVNLQHWENVQVEFDFAVTDLKGGTLEPEDTFQAFLTTENGTYSLSHNISHSSSYPYVFSGDNTHGPFVGTFFLDVPAANSGTLQLQAVTSAEAFSIDNVRFTGMPTATPDVPESGVTVMLAAGLGTALLFRRRKRR